MWFSGIKRVVKMEIKKEFKGNVGLFLVCAELSKRNLISMPTSRNTKGYDVVVLNPTTNKSIGVQVKCSDRKEFPILSCHWGDYKDKIKEKIIAPFIFVDISNFDALGYYILTKEELRELMKINIEKYINNRQRKFGMTLQELLEKEKREKRKSDLWVLRLDDVKDFKDKWDSIIELLR